MITNIAFVKNDEGNHVLDVTTTTGRLAVPTSGMPVTNKFGICEQTIPEFLAFCSTKEMSTSAVAKHIK
jgi:hypothetical protein